MRSWRSRRRRCVASCLLKQTNSTSSPRDASRLARSTAIIVLPDPAQPCTAMRGVRQWRATNPACSVVSVTSACSSSRNSSAIGTRICTSGASVRRTRSGSGATRLSREPRWKASVRSSAPATSSRTSMRSQRISRGASGASTSSWMVMSGNASAWTTCSLPRAPAASSSLRRTLWRWSSARPNGSRIGSGSGGRYHVPCRHSSPPPLTSRQTTPRSAWHSTKSHSSSSAPSAWSRRTRLAEWKTLQSSPRPARNASNTLRSALDFRPASCRVRGYMTAMALDTQRPSTRFLALERQIRTVLHDRPTG